MACSVRLYRAILSVPSDLQHASDLQHGTPPALSHRVAGQEEYSSMRDLYVRSGNAFLVVYSITGAVSLYEFYFTACCMALATHSARAVLCRVLFRAPLSITKIVLLLKRLPSCAILSSACATLATMAFFWSDSSIANAYVTPWPVVCLPLLISPTASRAMDTGYCIGLTPG